MGIFGFNLLELMQVLIIIIVLACVTRLLNVHIVSEVDTEFVKEKIQSVLLLK